MTPKNKQLNILAILPKSIGGRLTTSSIIDGIVANGHCVCVFDELNDSKTMAVELLDSQNPDFIIGYDFCALAFCDEYNLNFRTLNYFSDVIEDSHSGPDWEKYYPELKKEKNYTFYWDKKLCEKKRKEIKNLFYLPHFVNTAIYKNLNLQTEYDILFAGRLDTDFRLKSFVELLKTNPALSCGWFAIKKHYDDALNRSSEDEKPLLSKVYKGFIDNEKDMAVAINKTKIVINFNQQGVSSLNYRTIQTMSCEKLILNDSREEGTKFFGKDFLTYNDVEDLSEKINFYLNNKDAYLKNTGSIKKIIDKDFSHRTGAKKMLEMAGFAE